MGTGHATPIATSRAYQFAASESIKGTEFRLVLARMSNSSQLAKLDPDTFADCFAAPPFFVRISAGHVCSRDGDQSPNGPRCAGSAPPYLGRVGHNVAPALALASVW